jgi:1,4-dihydroxy-2-naphthoate octaprenyltransferase
MTGGTYLVTTGTWDWGAALIGTVYALAPTAVIFGKHVDKIDFDAAKGVRTLPVRLGAARSLSWIVSMTVLQYLALGALVADGALPGTALIALLALPDAARLVRTCRAPRPGSCPEGYPESAWPLWYVAFAFAHARSFGLLFLLGLLLAWPLEQALALFS